MIFNSCYMDGNYRFLWWYSLVRSLCSFKLNAQSLVNLMEIQKFFNVVIDLMRKLSRKSGKVMNFYFFYDLNYLLVEVLQSWDMKKVLTVVVILELFYKSFSMNKKKYYRYVVGYTCFPSHCYLINQNLQSICLKVNERTLIL